MKKQLLVLALLASFIGHSQTIGLELFAEGFTSPVEIAHAGDSRLFVVEQAGRIKILNADGSVTATPFLDISSIISSGGERGLLGLAFHPDYDDNGYFFVNYTNPAGNTVIARYSVSSSDPSVADPESALPLLTVVQPYPNHNGGCLRFGADGYLYISMGDGGSGGDPNNNAQTLSSLLGKMLRIDIDNGDPYSIPATNPFTGQPAAAGEIWAYGLRNAWKFSFNRTNGDLWIADVGQNAIEEINKATAGDAGLNYGWRCYEGTEVYNDAGCSAGDTYTPPFAEYTHNATNGCSVTGGYVYTGGMYPNLLGKYIFADYCNNKLGILDTDGSITYTEAYSGNNFTTFGEDMAGELYVAGKSSGDVFKITDTSLSTKYLTTSAFTIYPNPAADAVYIQKGTSGSYPAAVQVYDLSGKLLTDAPLKDMETNMVSLHNYPAGFYMMNITDSRGAKHSYKLAVQ